MKKKTLFISLITITLLIVISLGVISFVNYKQSQFAFQGPSMLPTLHDGQLISIEKYLTNSKPQRGDIVVYSNPKYQASESGSPERLAHRIIGLPGDKIIIKDGSVSIVNTNNPGGFNLDTGTGIIQPTKPDQEITLSSDEYFLLGDNRPNAFDSRYVGPIKEDNMIGKVVLSR